MIALNTTGEEQEMLSYHNDPAIKAKYIARFEAHRKADEVVQGIGFEKGRGCFVGCTFNKYDHSQFPIVLGWPEWLARLADIIFDGLPEDEAPQFGTDLLNAVPVGVDLDPIKHPLTIRRMERLITLCEQNTIYETTDVISALRAVKCCAESEVNMGVCDWSAAESAARSAAYIAERDHLLDVLRGLK